jgi:catechol 2,3-dioxygenase-like lactoylglutathione lyase family enzyme
VPVVLFLFVILLSPVAGVAHAAEADLHHVHLTVTNGDVAAQWYIDHMGCRATPARTDAAQCGDLQLLFIGHPARGGNEGTAVDHISFSVADLAAKIKQLIAVGVAGFGVRIMNRESPIHDEPGLFKVAFVKDPWGTKIELVEDPEHLGFHHLHLFSADPKATLTWYQNAFGGKLATLKGSLTGILFGKAWLIISQSTGPGALRATEGRTVDHIGFAVADLDMAVADLKNKGVQFRGGGTAGSTAAGESTKAVMIAGPDNILVEVVQR